jgi:two-component system chemotaxis response regulator CheY
MASILVIDDDVQLQEFIQIVLEEKGHEIRCSGDGVAGLKAHRQRPADLILCDLFMPEKEGLETIRELHREFPNVKVIAISGGCPRDGRMDFLPLAKQFGAVAAELADKVEHILRG